MNFTAYQELKKVASKWQPELTELPSYQHMMIGLISGAMGPFSNAPIDTIKTRKSRAYFHEINPLKVTCYQVYRNHRPRWANLQYNG